MFNDLLNKTQCIMIDIRFNGCLVQFIKQF